MNLARAVEGANRNYTRMITSGHRGGESNLQIELKLKQHDRAIASLGGREKLAKRFRTGQSFRGPAV